MQGFPHHYHVTVSGQIEGNVIVRSEGLPDVDTQSPPEFGGPEGIWSPETLLTASVADCFVLSFRAIARASKFDWVALECDVEGVLDRPERSTYFTEFHIHAVLSVADGSRLELAQRLLEKSEQICLVTASLKSKVKLTTDIQLAG